METGLRDRLTQRSRIFIMLSLSSTPASAYFCLYTFWFSLYLARARTRWSARTRIRGYNITHFSILYLILLKLQHYSAFNSVYAYSQSHMYTLEFGLLGRGYFRLLTGDAGNGQSRRSYPRLLHNCYTILLITNSGTMSKP